MNAIGVMYHDVTAPGAEDGSGFPGGDAARYKLTPAQFDAHLAALQHVGVTVQLVDRGLPAASCAIFANAAM
jgi:hypothetical protein